MIGILENGIIKIFLIFLIVLREMVKIVFVKFKVYSSFLRLRDDRFNMFILFKIIRIFFREFAFIDVGKEKCFRCIFNWIFKKFSCI